MMWYVMLSVIVVVYIIFLFLFFLIDSFRCKENHNKPHHFEYVTGQPGLLMCVYCGQKRRDLIGG